MWVCGCVCGCVCVCVCVLGINCYVLPNTDILLHSCQQGMCYELDPTTLAKRASFQISGRNAVQFAYLAHRRVVLINDAVRLHVISHDPSDSQRWLCAPCAFARVFVHTLPVLWLLF